MITYFAFFILFILISFSTWIYFQLKNGMKNPMRLALTVCLLFGFSICAIGLNFKFWTAEDLATQGAMLAGVFTGAAAFFTLANLIYSAERDRQRDEELREEKRRQQKKDQEQTEFITKQTELIIQQQELGQIQKYITHRKLFNEMITLTLSETKNNYKVTNVNNLYSYIFPQNSIYNINTGITLGTVSPLNNNLVEAINLCQFNIESYQQDILRLITNGPEILAKLMLYTSKKRLIGDILFNSNFTGYNFFDFNLFYKDIEIFLNGLLLFTENKPVEFPIHHQELSSKNYLFHVINGGMNGISIYDYKGRAHFLLSLYFMSIQSTSDVNFNFFTSFLERILCDYHYMQTIRKDKTFFDLFKYLNNQFTQYIEKTGISFHLQKIQELFANAKYSTQ
ncbi:hypothetical protein LWC08_06455 [Desulfobaculum bizertense]|uniref:hypothetical protein n=1 Tax=Desulfobaculum bizertense TaxID=376490 RepID=UPI001F3C0FAF|nr:hypothetical protein [Desulfobaculum bizertense]UIJ39209.1 hypothetical protein LWC08_06455 [Desulfobaculum bizertense]